MLEPQKVEFDDVWAISDRAIQQGMDTWDLDRINAEVRKIRER